MNLLKKSKNISWTKILDKIVILDTRENQIYHELNEVASFIWENLDNYSAQDELAAEISNQYDIPVKDALEDLSVVIQDFKSKQLLINE